MNVPRTQVYILGGGFAGLYTALQLDKFSWKRSLKPQITLIDQNDRFLFTPFLYELVTQELQQWEIAPPYLKLLVDTDIQFCRGAVQQVDLKNRQLRLQTGQVLTYDRLVFAVGRETSLDIIPGASTYALPFRTLADANRLKEKLRYLEASEQSIIRVAIAGGGPSGVELAGKLADRLQERGEIRLIERGATLLKSFTTFSQRTAHQVLAAHQVRVDLETKIQSIGYDSITLENQGQVKTVSVDLVLWTAGTGVNSSLRHLDCRQNPQGQLLTRPTLQLLDYPEVFALGDLANIFDYQGKPIPATAQSACQQANCAAYNLRASLSKLSLRHFHYVHLGEMLTLGINTAIVSSLGFINLKGHIGYVTRQLVYLLLRMPTLKHRIQVAKHWLFRFFHIWLSGKRSKRRVSKNRWQSSSYAGQNSQKNLNNSSVHQHK